MDRAILTWLRSSTKPGSTSLDLNPYKTLNLTRTLPQSHPLPKPKPNHHPSDNPTPLSYPKTTPLLPGFASLAVKYLIPTPNPNPNPWGPLRHNQRVRKNKNVPKKRYQ